MIGVSSRNGVEAPVHHLQRVIRFHSFHICSGTHGMLDSNPRSWRTLSDANERNPCIPEKRGGIRVERAVRDSWSSLVGMRDSKLQRPFPTAGQGEVHRRFQLHSGGRPGLGEVSLLAVGSGSNRNLGKSEGRTRRTQKFLPFFW